MHTPGQLDHLDPAGVFAGMDGSGDGLLDKTEFRVSDQDFSVSHGLQLQNPCR